MDTTDPAITFDAAGVCNHCIEFETVTRKRWFPGPEGEPRLRAMVESIKAAAKGNEYDCILGLSGGVDSSYLALKVKDLGLNPLVVHVDAGWNSELAVSNIERIVKHCGYDLHTHVVDWEEMRDLQLAFMKAAVANQDVPQDHAFFSSLYHFAIKSNIKTIVSGGNISTEGIFPKAWHGAAMDAWNLKAIHAKYGTGRLKQYRTISFFEYYIYYPLILGMRTVRPLNFMPYDKTEAVKYLQDTIGYRPYARKHGESIFTKFFQNYYLPTKFGYDKRRPHLASLVVSGQMTREEALRALEEPLYDPQELAEDIGYFCKKLQIDRAEFDQIMAAPIHHYTDFANWDGAYRRLKKVQGVVEKIRGKRMSVYS
ncbi:N-acetyl sugar amidotransferase [Bordetella bronchiseptica]